MRALLLLLLAVSITAPAAATPTVTDAPTPNASPTTDAPGDPDYTPIWEPQATPTAEPTPTPAIATNRGPPNGRNIELSPATSISRYWYVDGTFIVELRSQMATDVTIVESIGARGDGAHRLNKRSVPISPGRSLVRLEAPPIGGEASATITTRQSEYVIGLRSSTGSDLLDGPFAGTAVSAAALAGILVAGVILPVGITIVRARRKGGRFL